MNFMECKVLGNEPLDAIIPDLFYFYEKFHGFIPFMNVQSSHSVVTHCIEIPHFQGEY